MPSPPALLEFDSNRAGPIVQRKPSPVDRDARRLAASAAIALSLHALSALFRPPARAMRAPVAEDTHANLLLSVEELPREGSAAPGGGSPEPEPEPEQKTRSAPEQRVAPAHQATRVVVHALAPKEAPQANDQPDDTTQSELGPAPADLLASAEGSGAPAPERPRAARSFRLNEVRNESAASPDAAVQEQSASASLGDGFGENGGPGGDGRGNGHGVSRSFAFGGTKGAFHADICFIEDAVKRLADITHCTPIGSFSTDVINVEPRRFNEGFPGVSTRTAWFAIKYRGKFHVETADYYTFRLLSDDGAILHIDGYPIIDNDGQHMPRSLKNTITLEAGEHEFSLFYYQGPPEFLALQLFVTPFNGSERLFGPKL